MRLGAGAAVVFGLIGTALLIGLGTWQLKRMVWKNDLIAGLEQRLSQDPVAVPKSPDAERDKYLRVAVKGSTDGRELHLLVSQMPWGAGFRVIAPLADTSGRVILVDLGYVPEATKDPAARPAATVEVVGALYWPDETDGFTPAPDRARNIWFARDLGLMAEALGTEPLLIVAERHGGGDWPKPLRLGVNLPNDHLQYAITWFSLALIWAVMSAMLVRREWRPID
ncbi:MAG TPA: SURF1 family protein [Thermohalobaculum sp.]|nr:SURF1 family protein [Thermohalobaculum sp.]